MTREPDDAALRMHRIGWWEEYGCGCVSATVARKRDLLGYCPVHGEGSRGAQPDYRVALEELPVCDETTEEGA